MDVRNDERDWSSAFVLDPVGARAELGEVLTGGKLLRRPIVMVVGQDPGHQVDDGGIALMTMQADMATGRYHRPTEAQFTVLNAVDLLGEVDAGQHVLGDQFIVRRRR